MVLCWEMGSWVDELEGEGTKEMLVTSACGRKWALFHVFLAAERLFLAFSWPFVGRTSALTCCSGVICLGTLVVICVFLLVFGGTTQWLLRALAIRMGEDAPENHLSGHMLTCTRDCGRTVDRRCLWPCLVGEPEQADESLTEVARHAVHEVLKETGLTHRSQAPRSC